MPMPIWPMDRMPIFAKGCLAAITGVTPQKNITMASSSRYCRVGDRKLKSNRMRIELNAIVNQTRAAGCLRMHMSRRL